MAAWFRVGLDFGTIKTVAAYTNYQDPVTELWEDPRHHWQIPSVIAYDEEGRVLWGHEAMSQRNPYTWSKLLVDGSPAVDVPGDNLRGVLGGRFGRGANKPVAEVVGDFLGALRPHILDRLRMHTPQPLVEWRITTPYCWSPQGREVFRAAVERAGFATHGPVSYLSEAEAAAQWVASQLKAPNHLQLQAGDRLIVCDAGGATIDTATLEVGNVVDGRPQGFQVVGQPESVRHGGVDVDSALMELIRTARQSPNLIRAGRPAYLTHQAIIEVKETFTGDDRPRTVQVHQTRSISQHTFQPGDLAGAFDPVLRSMSRLIHAQAAQVLEQRPPTGTTFVILTGGVSKSTYVRAQLGQILGDAFSLLPPLEDPIGPVARGASLWDTFARPGAAGTLGLFDNLGEYRIQLPLVEPAWNGLQDRRCTHPAIPRGRVTDAEGSLDALISIRPEQGAPHFFVIMARDDDAGPPIALPMHTTAPVQDARIHLWDETTGEKVGQYPVRVFWWILTGAYLEIKWEVYTRQGSLNAERIAFLTHRVPAGTWRPL